MAILGTMYLYYLVCEELLMVHGMVGDDDVGLRAFLHNHQNAAVYHSVLLALEHVVYLYGMLGTGVAGHMYKQGVHGKHGVQCHDAVLAVRYIIIIRCKVDVRFPDGAAELGAFSSRGGELYAVVGSKVLCYVGISVSLYLLGRETLFGEDTQGLLPVGVHQCA